TWAEFGQTFWRDPSNQSINSFLHHALVPWDGFHPWLASTAGVANGLTVALALMMAATMILALILSHRHNRDSRPAFALVVLTSLLVPSIMWDHYLVQALSAAILLWTALTSPALRLLVALCVGLVC